MIKIIFVLIFLYSNCAISGEIIEGTVVGVNDGDTLTLLTAGNQILKIRLSEIDSPESDQAFGQRAKQSLSDMVFKKAVQVEKETLDKYGRTVGTVFVSDLDVNREQVKRGESLFLRKIFPGSCSKNQQKSRDRLCLRRPRSVLSLSLATQRGVAHIIPMT